MTQINVVGNFLGSSGYELHTRNLINSLFRINKVRLTTSIPPRAETLLTDKELEMIKTKPTDDEINLIITNPLHWRIYTTAKRNWVYLIYEGDSVPKSILEECMNPDIEYIFCPSEHTKKAVLTTANNNTEYILNKIKVVPHGVNNELFYPKEKNNEKFTFLVSKGWRNLEDRGGTQYAIQAFLEEFTNKDNVELIVKINPAYGIPDINNMVEQIRPKDKSDYPPIRINIDNIHYSKLVDLYNKADVFVMSTRAESFGIPGIEAMACGLPVITTNFGGQVDYCNEKNSWLVGGNLVEMQQELMYEGIKWLTPNISEIRKAMREAYENKEIVKSKSKEAIKTGNIFTWDSTANLIVTLIN